MLRDFRGRNIRTVRIPLWVKKAVDAWTEAVQITEGPVSGGASLSSIALAPLYPDSYQQDGEDGGGYHYLFARHGKTGRLREAVLLWFGRTAPSLTMNQSRTEIQWFSGPSDFFELPYTCFHNAYELRIDSGALWQHGSSLRIPWTAFLLKSDG